MRGTLSALLLAALAAAGASAAPAPQRQRQRVLVEAVEIDGNYRLGEGELLRHVRTRRGRPYDEGQVMRDLHALLDLGVFDATQTRVSVGDGRRGGKVVVFTVAELPVVAELKVRGRPAGLAESEVLRAARAEGRGLKEGGLLDPPAMRRALDGVRALLAARGLSGLSVGCSVDEVSAWRVSVVIELGEGRPL